MSNEEVQITLLVSEEDRDFMFRELADLQIELTARTRERENNG